MCFVVLFFENLELRGFLGVIRVNEILMILVFVNAATLAGAFLLNSKLSNAKGGNIFHEVSKANVDGVRN